MNFRPCKLTIGECAYTVDAAKNVICYRSPLGYVRPENEREMVLAEVKRRRHNNARKFRDQTMRDIGMVKVRGNLGGTYWE